MGTAKIQRKRPDSVIRKGLTEVLPTSIQKSYFLLKDAERGVLNIALEKYRPGQSGPILVGDFKVFKPALRLMTWYRLVIEEIHDSHVTTSFTRWLDAVQVRGADDKEVYVTFSPRFEHLWLESKKRLLKYADQKPAQMELRSQYAIRLYGWAKKHVTVGKKTRPIGAAPKSARAGIGKRCRGKLHSRGSVADLGEPASEGLGHCDCGVQSDNGLKYCA
jgi:hypothetical protein